MATGESRCRQSVTITGPNVSRTASFVTIVSTIASRQRALLPRLAYIADSEQSTLVVTMTLLNTSALFGYMCEDAMFRHVVPELLQ